jgi:hypothetical protein
MAGLKACATDKAGLKACATYVLLVAQAFRPANALPVAAGKLRRSRWAPEHHSERRSYAEAYDSSRRKSFDVTDSVGA